MQYILTEEEYKAINRRSKELDELPSKKELQKFCTMVANTLPVSGGWYDGKVWGCILTKKDDDGYDEWYCDQCPSRKICPYDYKEWSK